ncbi:unnamed protein product, partial [Symbiodinium pilosum]
ARGNGRAVRNVIEAAIRRMARRLYRSNAEKEEYSKLAPEDFADVLEKNLQTLFAVPCGPRGALSKISKLASADVKKFQFFAELAKELQGGKKEITTRLHRTTSQIAVASQLRNVSGETRKHLEVCQAKQEDARTRIIHRLELYCAEGGMLDVAAQDIRTTSDKKVIEKSSNLLK